MAKKLTLYQINQIRHLRKTHTAAETARLVGVSVGVVKKTAPGLRKVGYERKFATNGRPLEVIKEGYFDTNVIDWIV